MSDLTIQKLEEEKLKKSILATSSEFYRRPDIYSDKQKRGITVLNTTQLVGWTGRDEQDRLQTVTGETPLFYLTLSQREEIFRLSAPIFGVVTSRMNRISSIDFTIEPTKNDEDKIADNLKNLHSLYKEYSKTTDLKFIVVKSQIVNRIKEVLIDILPDLSNFNQSLLRWRKRIMQGNSDLGNEIQAWLQQPSLGTSWTDWIKKVVFDLMIHGCVANYKQMERNKVENFDTLPGGTVYKIRNTSFGGAEAYLQAVFGFEYQLFFSDELSYRQYAPTSSHSYSFIPLEALINKIAEDMLYDRLMADQADGTKPPEKLIIITDNKNPFGDFDNNDVLPSNPDEQKRIESKVNEPRKGSIMTFSGNDAKIIDLSRENTMALQNQRQKDIRETVAMVFNMSNMEINLTGSDDTSGRNTSEAQAEIERGKGIMPILGTIESIINRDILPYRYGFGYQLKYQSMKDDVKERQLDAIKLNDGELTVNELREKYNLPIFDGDEFNKPKGTQVPMGTELSPLFTRPIE